MFIDFIICLLIASPFFVAFCFRRPLARWLDDRNRKVQIEHQIIKGRRDGRLTREVLSDMQRKGRL